MLASTVTAPITEFYLQFNLVKSLIRDQLTFNFNWTLYQRVALGAYNTERGFNFVIDYNSLISRADFVSVVDSNMCYFNRTTEFAAYVISSQTLS